jgi:hypothetical protein
MWKPATLSFDIVADDTDDPVVAAIFETPAGRIFAMADVTREGRALILRGLHMHSDGPNLAGPANLRQLAELVLERMDYDDLIIEGAIRTTGAGPGRRPRRIRFTRRSRDSAGRQEP